MMVMSSNYQIFNFNFLGIQITMVEILYIFIFLFFIILNIVKVYLKKSIVPFKKLMVTLKRTVYIPLFLILFCFACNSILGNSNLKWLSEIFNLTITLENLIAIAMMLLLVIGFKYKNKVEYFDYTIKFFFLSATVLLFLNFTTNTFIWFEYGNFMMPILLYAAYVFKNSMISKTENDTDNLSERSDIERRCESELFSERKIQKQQILKYIKSISNNTSPSSLCISGDWGQGKTTIVNVILNELVKEEYVVIHIKLLDIDDIEILFRVFFEQLEEALKQKMYYTGSGSEYNVYLESIYELIANKKFDVKQLFLSKGTEGDVDYRSAKSSFEILIKKMVKNKDIKKIIIVIDDIERCKDTKIIEFISFIKEIASFPHSITFFITDYNKLQEKGVTHEYLEKFINKRFELYKLNEVEIINYFIDRKIYLNEEVFENANYQYLTIYMKKRLVNEIEEIFKKMWLLISEYDEKIKTIENPDKEIIRSQTESEKNNKLRELEINALKKEKYAITELSNDILRKFNNIRRLKLFLNEIDDMILGMDLIFDKMSTLSYEKFKEYTDSVKIVQSIILLAFIKIFVEKEFSAIQKLSLESYINSVGINIKESPSKEIVKAISKGVWISESMYSDETKLQDIISAANSLIYNPYSLKEIVTKFETHDDRILRLFDSNDEDIDLKTKEGLLSLQKMILESERRSPNLFAERQLHCFNCIYDKVGSLLSIEDLFSILDVNFCRLHRNIIDSQVYNICYGFIKKLKEENKLNFQYAEYEIILKKIDIYQWRFVDENINYLYRVFRYGFYNVLTQDEYNIHMENMGVERSFEQCISKYCQMLIDYGLIASESKGVYGLLEFYAKCEEIAKSSGYIQYEEVNEDFKRVKAFLNNLDIITKIIDEISACFDRSAYNIDISSLKYNNISESVDRLLLGLNLQSVECRYSEYIDNFFKDILNNSKTTVYSNEEISLLNKLATEFHKKYGIDYGANFRYMIFKIEQNQKGLLED